MSMLRPARSRGFSSLRLVSSVNAHPAWVRKKAVNKADGNPYMFAVGLCFSCLCPCWPGDLSLVRHQTCSSAMVAGLLRGALAVLPACFGLGAAPLHVADAVPWNDLFAKTDRACLCSGRCMIYPRARTVADNHVIPPFWLVVDDLCCQAGVLVASLNEIPCLSVNLNPSRDWSTGAVQQGPS